MSSQISVPKSVREIRQSFIDFFKNKEHEFVPSAPVCPADDPTLMFTNAGMNQFKPIFLGDNKKGLKRATNSQKCIRVSGKHNDLEEVGRDTYHHTFFEMLGNWSFGDYYKKEAITWAWELLTEVWKLDKNRLFVTVYKDDDEAAKLWVECTDIPAERVMRFGDKENFWEMGDVGPCGPCSEIHYDRGDIASQKETFADPVLGVNGENDRYIEIWNLVFIQYQRLASKELKPLEQTHVDTGMGLERVCAILQGVRSNYDTDIFKAVIHKIAELSGVPYLDDESGTAHRVIADHLRTVAFSIADGVMPSNEGRGYVIRRVLRRASRFARSLGQEQSFLWKLLPTLVAEMGGAFPEIGQRQHFVEEVIKAEEERFIRTLGTGLERFDKMVEEAQKAGQKVLSGEGVFTLYDTFGFPVDLVRLLAEEKGFEVDEIGFEKFMEEQKSRARNAQKTGVDLGDGEDWVILNPEQGTEFLGYENDVAEVQISRFRVQGEKVDFVALQTPFYAESGGQVGERGLIEGEGVVLRVVNTLKVNGIWVHNAEVLKGVVTAETMGGRLKAMPDSEERKSTRANHSATHLLQAALQKVLGSHVEQQGSRVSAESLRFDFSHFQAVSVEELREVEKIVNKQIRENLGVQTVLKDLEEAKSSGAMALFGEKYDEKVRVVSMGDFSMELCGGLHVASTGNIGLFHILSESSTAAGVRRIEAVTGQRALDVMNGAIDQVEKIRSMVKCKPSQVLDRVQLLVQQSRELEKKIEELKAEAARGQLKSLMASAQKVGDRSLLIQELDGEPSALKGLVEELASSMQNGVAVLAAKNSQSGSIAVVVSKNLIPKLNAGKLVREISAVANGKGGGRPDKAQAGTKSPEKIGEALKFAQTLLEGALV